MTLTSKFEIAIILGLGLGAPFMASELPSNIGIGRLLLSASALLLLQGLVRDLWLLSRGRNADEVGTYKLARCMCVESTVGTVGVLIGVLLLGLGFDSAVVMTGNSWAMLIVAVLGLGFVAKDFVLEWNPWRIYRDIDHMNIIFTWRAK